jgi:lysosomal acid lipase/cholesteryl ester hydrolase
VVRSGRFCKYDYGFFGNLDKYSSLTPPEYDISAIPASLPILLAHGGNDALADPEDVNILISSLPGTPEVLNLPNYAHGDFVMGTTARSDVYTQVLKFFQA